MGKFMSTITFRGTVGNNTGRRTKNGLVLGVKSEGPVELKPLTIQNNNQMKPVFIKSAEILKNLTGIEFVNKFNSINSRGVFTKLFRVICGLETGVRGKLPFLLSLHKELIQGKTFGKRQFANAFSGTVTGTQSIDRITSTVTITPWTVGDVVKPPKGATAFRIVSQVQVISDMTYDDPSDSWQNVDAVNNGIHAEVYSPYFPIDTPSIIPVVITAALPGAPVLTADTTVINTIGIEFYQEVNTVYYAMVQDVASTIIAAY